MTVIINMSSQLVICLSRFCDNNMLLPFEINNVENVELIFDLGLCHMAYGLCLLTESAVNFHRVKK